MTINERLSQNWPPSRARLMVFWIALVGTFVQAVALRFEDMSATIALQDSIGPYLAAERGDYRSHTPAYGPSLWIPYKVALWFAGSLWEATIAIKLFHALMAPLSMILAWHLSNKRLLVSILIGLIAAADPGLLDTARSGSEGYFASLFVVVGCIRRGFWSWIAFAFAVGNHPYAALLLPLWLVRENLQRRAIPGACIAGAIILIQVLGWGDAGLDQQTSPFVSALRSYSTYGAGWAWIAICGPLVGLLSSNTRAFALRVFLCLALMAIASHYVGYLRDHHVRLLTIPMAVCWAAMPRFALLVSGILLGTMAPHDRPPEVVWRADTLGLLTASADTVSKRCPQCVVDRAWLDGSAAIEPSALMLDLKLRGHTLKLPSDDEAVVLITAAEHPTIQATGLPGEQIMAGRGYALSVASVEQVRAWSKGLCTLNPRLGGAWDAVSIFRPETTTEQVRSWWACP